MRGHLDTIGFANVFVAWCFLACAALGQTVSSTVSTSPSSFRNKASRTIQQGVPTDFPAAATLLVNRLRRLPAQGIEGDFELRELVAMLNRSGVPTLVDRRGLEEQNLSLDETITISNPRLTMDERLSYALNAIDFGWTVVGRGEAILISSTSRIEETLMVATYDLSRLTSTDNYDSIVDAITSTVSPESWEDVGGNGSIKVVNVRGRNLLVVSTNYHRHREISRLLNSLHRMGGSSLTRGWGQPYRSSETGRLAISRPIELPNQNPKRGINLPGSKSKGNMGGFGGGMMGMGGMF